MAKLETLPKLAILLNYYSKGKRRSWSLSHYHNTLTVKTIKTSGKIGRGGKQTHPNQTKWIIYEWFTNENLNKYKFTPNHSYKYETIRFYFYLHSKIFLSALIKPLLLFIEWTLREKNSAKYVTFYTIWSQIWVRKNSF